MNVPAPRPPQRYLPAARGASSRTILAIAWDHAVTPSPTAVTTDGRTSGSMQRVALEPGQALAQLAGEDRRPLLVLRECLGCAGTEAALMSDKEDNERTYLLARWFHCVKLPPDVLASDHPYHDLFEGEEPAHLFIASHDGRRRHDLEGEHSRRELWGAMEAELEASYLDDYDVRPAKLQRLLDQLDEIDRALCDLETRYELAIASQGAASGKVEKLGKKIALERARRDELVAEAVELGTLELRPPPAPGTKK